jgi:lysophospholipase L1-like esterase
LNRTLRVWIANLALSLVAVLLTLAAFEVGLRLFMPQKLYRFPRGLFCNLADRVYGLKPGFRGMIKNPEYRTAIRINSLGLRGAEVGSKGPRLTRILVLGDSFVSAFNVDEQETFVAVLENGLRRSGEGPIEVVNAGTPGYGTWHEIRTLRALFERIRPDLVVLCVYLGNDLQDNLTPRSAVVRDGFLVGRRKSGGILPDGLRSWLQRHSMSYVFFWDAWDRVRPWFGMQAVDPLEHFKAIVSRRPDRSIQEAVRISQALMAEMASFANDNRLALTVMLIPDEMQVYPQRFREQLARAGEDFSDFDLDLPGKSWSEMALKLGVPILDLLPIFRAHAVRGAPSLYMSLDGHLSRAGNRLTGETIRDALLPLLAAHRETP